MLEYSNSSGDVFEVEANLPVYEYIEIEDGVDPFPDLLLKDFAFA